MKRCYLAPPLLLVLLVLLVLVLTVVVVAMMHNYDDPGDDNAAAARGRAQTPHGRLLGDVGLHPAVPLPGIGIRPRGGAHEPDGGL